MVLPVIYIYIYYIQSTLDIAPLFVRLSLWRYIKGDGTSMYANAFNTIYFKG